ncbi:MAG: PKD domain-containing protein, partial [Ferruginibacter sp.]
MGKLKYFFILMMVLAFQHDALANHTKGGWIYYEYVGPGSTANTLKYRITLKLYTACSLNEGQFNATINFSIFDGANGSLYRSVPVTYSDIEDIQNCTTRNCHPCISFIPSICYKITTYSTVQDLPSTPAGFIVAYQRCCRISGIVNVQSPSNNIGETWTVNIPGTQVAGAEINSSAKFQQNDTAIICQDAFFTFNFGATDVNGDSLVYDFTPAYGGGATGNATPDPASPPPYSSVPYSGGFSGSEPMGSRVTINRNTGLVSGIGPSSGIYVLTVTVSEYRRGTNIKVGEVRKSLHIEVALCTLTQASLNPEYISCDGFTINFSNNASSVNIQSYFWDFGDGTTSTDEIPIHTYADTGRYILKLVVNKDQACSDSATAIVKVFPGYFPDFRDNSPTCKGVPVQFNDGTRATYGNVNYWHWDFGLNSVFNDTSRLQNPMFTYPVSGDYIVTFIVASNKGCIDTVVKTISIVDKAPFTITPRDTLICNIDTLQLHARATTVGNVVWTPNYNISSTTSFDPFVSPDVSTTYYASYADNFGCSARDSVRVNVVTEVSLQALADTSICATDSITIQVNSNALYYTWTPAAGLSKANIKSPKASPVTTTRYHLYASIGKCFKETDITIKPVPYPQAFAGKDTSVCLGKDAQLYGSGGSIYSWTPARYLSSADVASPKVIQPQRSVQYLLEVKDTLGCPKPSYDTVYVEVVNINANAG